MKTTVLRIPVVDFTQNLTFDERLKNECDVQLGIGNKLVSSFVIGSYVILVFQPIQST